MSQPSPKTPSRETVLVVDDDRAVLHLITKALAPLEKTDVHTAGSASDALKAIEQGAFDVVLLDILLPDESGLEFFRKIQQRDRRLPVVFITAGAGSESAIEAMQLGAFDYVAKPLDLVEVRELVEKALKTRRMMNVPVAVPSTSSSQAGELFVGRSRKMLDVFKSIGRVAGQNVTVLIRGESGTGKELVARALYQHSDRSGEPFMAVNCAALPETLLESELFGHEKGAFTGAERRRIGKFEQCDGGTIFLDEVGDMAPLLQAKVLRLLQEQRYERVGGNETISTNVRIIAATNCDLEQMVEANEFRPDLFYRLNGLSIWLPPLRERPEDIPLLLEYFLDRANEELDKPRIEGIVPEALELLASYPWPGNVRELQSVVRRAVLNATGPVIVPEFLPAEVRGEPLPGAGSRKTAAGGDSTEGDLFGFIESRLNCESTNLYAETLEFMERYLLTRVLRATQANQSKAAEILGITRGKIRDRVSSFNISMDKHVRIEGDEE